MVSLQQMQTRFYLERRKDAVGKLLLRDRPVFMSVSLGGERVMVGTGIKSDFSAWDREVQRKRTGFPGATLDNAWLNTLSETAESAFLSLQNEGREISADLFLNKFRELKPKFSTGFFEVFFLFMESGSGRWAETTFLKVKTIYHHLRDFESRRDGRLGFQKINNDFLLEFQQYYSEKGNHLNTTRKAVNIIVWFLNWATREGYNRNMAFREFYKMLGPANSDKRVYPYLKWEELMRINDLVPLSRKQEQVRDMYCFMCFTGLRFSELRNLLKQDIREGEVIVKSGTGKTRKVTLNQRAREIWNRYANKYYLNNSAFPPVNAVTLNKHLKRIALEAGLKRRVLMTDKSGEMKEICEIITVGTAVNTFIYNALHLGVPAELISRYTGIRHDSRINVLLSAMSTEEIRRFDP